MADVSTELDTIVPRHQLLDNTAAKHRTELVHRYTGDTSHALVFSVFDLC